MKTSRMKMRVLILFVGCLLIAGTALGQTAPAAPIEDGTVVIHDGKIAAVGEGVSIPAGAKVIDAKGLQVYPGLFDPVTQMGLSEIGAVRATVDTTETGSFNPDLVAA